MPTPIHPNPCAGCPQGFSHPIGIICRIPNKPCPRKVRAAAVSDTRCGRCGGLPCTCPEFAGSHSHAPKEGTDQ